MKKFLAFVLSIIMLLSLSACGQGGKAEKYCWNCGGGITKAASFCEHCGAEVDNTKNESEDALSDSSSSDESKSEETNKLGETSEAVFKRVPILNGLSESRAISELETCGFLNIVIEQVNEEAPFAETVTRTFPEGGEMADINQTITIFVN